jgi:uncharacterized protein YodC (DUF2158 family)
MWETLHLGAVVLLHGGGMPMTISRVTTTEVHVDWHDVNGAPRHAVYQRHQIALRPPQPRGWRTGVHEDHQADVDDAAAAV